MLTAPNKISPTLAMAGIELVNAAVHIAGALAFGSYNPGLVTSVLIFLPASALAYRWLNATVITWVGSFLWALLAHVMMVLGLVASTQ